MSRIAGLGTGAVDAARAVMFARAGHGVAHLTTHRVGDRRAPIVAGRRSRVAKLPIERLASSFGNHQTNSSAKACVLGLLQNGSKTKPGVDILGWFAARCCYDWT